MPQQEENPPVDDQNAPELSDPGVRATIEATQKAIEQAAAEIERSKRLLRETENLGDSETDTASRAEAKQANDLET